MLSRKVSDPRSCPLAVGLDEVASFYLRALFWGSSERGCGGSDDEETGEKRMKKRGKRGRRRCKVV
jgi:hypothetical protein